MNDVVSVGDFASTVTAGGCVCQVCGGVHSRVFYEVEGVPACQVRLLRTRRAALDCPKGDIRMRSCPDCGFIWNGAFDPNLVQYEEDYESTQVVSRTFNRFHERLAKELIERYDLKGKEVLEIGCGQGEFLDLLCALGVRQATGFDPVLRTVTARPNVILVKNWYSEAHNHLQPDFVVIKMVMEHIPDPSRFLGMLRRTLGNRSDVIVFAMMPEVTRILDLRAFWDIYYEHCCYFGLGPLAQAFRKAGFDVVDLWRDFGGQYVLISGRPGDGSRRSLPVEEMPDDLARKVDLFAERVASDWAAWRLFLYRELAQGHRVIIWGGGSKAVAFLTALNIRSGIDFVVDINPTRNGTYIAGTGQQIVTPDFLRDYRPDLVIVMSPIYLDEIRKDLASFRLSPRLMTIETTTEVRLAGTGEYLR